MAKRVLVGRNPRNTLVRAVVWVVVLVIIAKFVLVPIRVQGISMLPTFPSKGIKFINCCAYLFHPPQRGDIVAIETTGRHVMLCKRIIGLPGETIAFHEGRVLINGEPLSEPYVKFPCNWEQPSELIGPDEYYVVGDNRSMDFFQHDQGRADRHKIVGKVVP